MVLGIDNRTENWKTAFYFSPFFRDDASRLKLAEKLGEPGGTESGDVHIELFWKGMRDHLHKKSSPNKQYFPDFVERYRCLFPDLRNKIEQSALRVPKEWNYDMAPDGAVDKLGSNLVHTEIDVVLETPNHLFIGEAKHKSKLDAKSNYVLVHQLIRQYVMARILVDLRGYKKEVVSFIVRDAGDDDGREQVEFMRRHCCLKEKNILTWDKVKKLWP